MMKLKDLTTPVFELRDVKLPTRAQDIKKMTKIDGFTVDEGLHEWLRQNEWYAVGSGGSYSMVYQKGNDVLKVFKDEFQPGTRCLIRFHRMAQTANNPHFPKVYFVKTYRGEELEKLVAPQKHKQHYIIGTEALEEINVDRVWAMLPTQKMARKKMLAFLSVGALNIIPIHHAADDMGFIPSKPGSAGAMREVITFLKALAAEYMEENANDPLVQAYLTIRKMIKADRACFGDFGGNNTMMRKDGTLVLADPIGDATENHPVLR